MNIMIIQYMDSLNSYGDQMDSQSIRRKQNRRLPKYSNAEGILNILFLYLIRCSFIC
jgi:hypothetical protein